MTWKPKKGDEFRAYSSIDGREFFNGQFGVMVCTGQATHGKGNGGIYLIHAEDSEGREFTLDCGDWEFRPEKSLPRLRRRL